MSTEAPTSDADLLDLFRVEGSMGVGDLARALKVTATAVRQRLMRLLAQRLIRREVVRVGRGRPKHLYQLTEKGLRLTGSNFTDLALALWREISSLEDREARVARVAKTLAETYAKQIQGDTIAERVRSLSDLLAQRRIPVSTQQPPQQVVMTVHACPYPRLAEQDRTICEMERLLFSELLGHDVKLAVCRLEGGTACRFHAK